MHLLLDQNWDFMTDFLICSGITPLPLKRTSTNARADTQTRITETGTDRAVPTTAIVDASAADGRHPVTSARAMPTATTARPVLSRAEDRKDVDVSVPLVALGRVG